MARVSLNSAISRASGRIGDVEVRHYKGMSVLQKKQQRHQPWSHRQPGLRQVFKTYTAYAARVRGDAELRKLYAAAAAKRNCRLNYWQIAIRDQANPPALSRFTLHDYRPATGGRISVCATDDFEVLRVAVAVRDSAGAVLQFGDATYD